MEEDNMLNYKVPKCLKCDTETDLNDKNEWFCSQCGAPVVNRCSDYNCGAFLNGDAKFCKICGSSSTFRNFGLFDNIIPPSFDDELPF